HGTRGVPWLVVEDEVPVVPHPPRLRQEQRGGIDVRYPGPGLPGKLSTHHGRIDGKIGPLAHRTRCHAASLPARRRHGSAHPSSMRTTTGRRAGRLGYTAQLLSAGMRRHAPAPDVAEGGEGNRGGRHLQEVGSLMAATPVMQLPVISQCAAEGCAYNNDHTCHAAAIT